MAKQGQVTVYKLNPDGSKGEAIRIEHANGEIASETTKGREVIKMEKLTLTFELERETKNTYRYQEVGNERNKLYLPKDAVGDDAPASLKVTIQPK